MRHARPDYDRIQDPEGKIPGDEPVFIIRGQDVVGDKAVEAWANLAEAAGARDDIVKAARDQAHKMRKWRLHHGGKVPDMPHTENPGNMHIDNSMPD